MLFCEPKKRKELIWVFPKIGVPQNGWFIMENPIKMDDLGDFWKHPCTSYVGMPSIFIGKHSFFMCVIRSMTVIMIMIYYHRKELYSQHLLLLRNLRQVDKKKTLQHFTQGLGPAKGSLFSSNQKELPTVAISAKCLFFCEGQRSCLFHSACFCFPDESGDSFAKSGGLVRGNYPRKPRQTI